MAEKKGLIHRFIVGKDRDEHYARSTLPSNRWELFWDILKGRFWKIVLMNLMLIIGLIPAILILTIKTSLTAEYGSMLPFSGGLFVGYPFIPDLYELMFLYEFRLQIDTFMILIPCLMFAGLIMSGVFYIARNLVWSEGVFIANDFWKGFKSNFVQYLLLTFIAGLIFFMSVMNVSILNHTMIFSPDQFISKPWVNNLLKGLTYVMAGFLTIMIFYAFTIAVTYKVKFVQLIKNAFVLTLGLLPRNLLFMALALSPFLLILIFGQGMLASLLLGVVLLLGFSLTVIIWTIYSHWVFDSFINDKVEGATKNKGLYTKMAKDGKEVAKKSYFKNPKKLKPITDEEVKITELPTNFSRADLSRLAEEKEYIKNDSENWSKEHENDVDEDDIDDDIAEDDDTTTYEGYEDAMKLEGYDAEETEEVLETEETEEIDNEVDKDGKEGK